MARSIRIEYPGAYYHVMARGNRRERIYRDEEDRLFFLKTLGETCAMTGWRVHAWVLVGNHYHLLIETPEPNLVAGMQWLQNTYTRRFNARHRQWGRLFGDRYKAVLVEGSGYYYETLMDYIHLNPVPPAKREQWLACASGLETFGFPDTGAGRRRFVERLDRRARDEDKTRAGVPAPEPGKDGRMSHLKRGWYWGSQAFAQRVLAIAEKVIRHQHSRVYRSARERRAHGENEALRLLEQGLRAARMNEAELAGTTGSDARKVALAALLWKRTTVSQRWLATRLHMKSAANVSQQIKRIGRKRPHLPKSLQRYIDSVKI